MGEFDRVEERLKRIESQVRNLHERLRQIESAQAPSEPFAPDESAIDAFFTPAAPAPVPEPPPEPPPEPVKPPQPQPTSPPPPVTIVAESRPEPEPVAPPPQRDVLELLKLNKEQLRREQENIERAQHAYEPVAQTREFVPPRREPAPSILVTQLRALGLWPPERTGTLEAQIGAWWMTRIGMLFGVIGIASFGIYVTRDTPAWIRLAELVFCSLAITALGWRFERSLPRFGEVVFAGGLALLYFSSYGAYAINTIKVINNPVDGLVVQLLTVIAIGITGLVRRSQPTAMLAVVFGFTASLFSVRWGLEWSALATGLVLLAGSIFLLLYRGWFQPHAASVAGVWLVYLAIFYLHWRSGAAAGFERAIGYLACVMLANIAADWFSFKLGKTPPRQPRLITQYLNTSGAILLALLVTLTLYENRLESMYFTFGSLLLAASILYYLTSADFNLMHGFFIKAAALITLGVMTHFEGNARWVALAVQSAVLLGSAWRTRLKVTEAATIVVWLLSFCFLAQETFELDAKRIEHTGMLIFNTIGLMAIAWTVVSALVIGTYGRIFANDGLEDRRFGPCMAMSIALGFGALLIVLKLVDEPWHPTAAVIFAASLAGFALALRHWAPAAAGVLPLILAHFSLWKYEIPSATVGLDLPWINEAAVVAITLIAAMALAFGARRNPAWRDRSDVRQGLVIAHGLWLLAIFAIPMQTFPLEAFLATGIAVAWIASLMALVPAIGMPMSTACVALVYTPALFAVARLLKSRWLPYTSDLDPWLYLVFAAALAHVFSTWRFGGPFRRRFDARAPIRGLQAAHLWAAVLIGQIAIYHLFSGSDLMFAYGLAAVAVGVLAWICDQPYAILGAAYYLACAHALGYSRVAHNDTTALWPGATVSLLTLFAAAAIRRLPNPPSRDALTTIQLIAAAAALILIDIMLVNLLKADMTYYVTILWGVSAMIAIAAGFIERAKPMRIVGLLGLAICIPRAFVIDIHSMFYRIAAFIILGAVLLAVGYVYNKFRALIEKTDPAPPGASS